MSMFCYQCEQAAKGTGCTAIGVCGKQPDVAALQDLLVYTLKGIAFWANKARANGIKDQEIDRFMIDGLFTTVTNVDFDPERFPLLIKECVNIRESLKSKVSGADGPSEYPDGPADFQPESTLEGMITQGEGVGIKGDPDHKCTGRSAPARLTRVIELADEAGLEIPRIREIYNSR